MMKMTRHESMLKSKSKSKVKETCGPMNHNISIVLSKQGAGKIWVIKWCHISNARLLAKCDFLDMVRKYDWSILVTSPLPITKVGPHQTLSLKFVCYMQKIDLTLLDDQVFFSAIEGRLGALLELFIIIRFCLTDIFNFNFRICPGQKSDSHLLINPTVYKHLFLTAYLENIQSEVTLQNNKQKLIEYLLSHYTQNYYVKICTIFPRENQILVSGHYILAAPLF